MALIMLVLVGKITLYAFIHDMYAFRLLCSVQVGRCTS